MDIHEYQAKELLATFGVPVPRGGLAYSPEQAAYRAREIGGRCLVAPQTGASGKSVYRLYVEADPETIAVMMIGEIGGPQEAEAGAVAAPNPTELGATVAMVLAAAA